MGYETMTDWLLLLFCWSFFAGYWLLVAACPQRSRLRGGRGFWLLVEVIFISNF